MNSKHWVIMALAFGISGWSVAGMSQGTNTAAAFIDAGQYNTKDSASCGIQEAINALPPEGGTVMVPPGVQVLHRPIFMKPNSKLVGAGRSTVLKKDAAFLLKITEDAKKGQDYIVVEDTAKLKIGACIATADRNFHPKISNVLFITNIVGNKVYFQINRYPEYRTLQWDLAVARGARVMNLFTLIVPAANTLVTDMELDGNAREQMMDTFGDIIVSYGMLWSGIYPAQGKVERCWIHDCGIGVHVNSLTGIEIRNCEVYRNIADGIHVGGGPHSFISNNRIYDNVAGAGISFCYGNRKLIITGNEIMRNFAGIYCMGNGEAARDSTADRYTIVSQNIIYENRRAGLASGQGNLGPQDFVFTGNILQNNQQDHYRREAPAGIMFENPQRCVIANNRCFDDREVFPRYVLAKPVAAGESNISMVLADRNVYTEPAIITNDWLKIGTGATVGVYAVMSLSNKVIQLNQPVPVNLPAETPVTRVAAQKWGIAVIGPEARDNAIVGNVCAGSGSGGILVRGLSNNVVANNAGAVVIYDDAKLPIENYFPALATVTVSNGGFETDTDWQLAKDLSAYDSTAGVAHSGKRALKLTRPAGKGVSDAIIPAFPIQPNCRYRLKAWVRSNARTANGDVFLPFLFLHSNHEKPLGWFATPLGYAADPGFTGIYQWEALKWIQVGMEFLTGSQDTAMKIYCRMDNRCTGEGWVDDITLELLDQLAPPAGNLVSATTVKLSPVDTAPTLDGRLDDPGWKTAAALTPFVTPQGQPGAWSTNARICYDKNYLYVGFDCSDPRPQDLRRAATNEAGVFQDDAVAVLIQPDPRTEDHLQFAVSAGGARMDQFYWSWGQDTSNFNPDWQAAVSANSAGWTAEMRIPLAVLAGLPPSPGTAWGANFGRRQRDNVWPSWCATKNWHNVRDYGWLVF